MHSRFSHTKLLLSLLALSFLLPSIVSAGTIRKPPNNLGLTAYWSFNEGTSTAATDFSGNGRNGTLTNMDANASWVAGKRGKALFFDGTNEYVTTGQLMNKFFSTATGTISVWVKPTGSSPDATDAYAQATRIAGAAVQTNFAAGIARGTIGGLDRIWAFNYSSGETKVGVAYTNDVWTHIVFVHSLGTLYIYKDGVLADSVASGNTTGLGNNMAVGGSSTANYFNGTIDELRTYNRALSATEIANLYSSGTAKIKSSLPATTVNKTRTPVGSLQSGLVGHWTFDGSSVSGTSVADMSGNGNTGTLTNGASPTIGKIGQGVTFDGTNDYVNVPNTSGALAPGTGSFSATFWYKGTRTEEFLHDNGTFLGARWVISSFKYSFTGAFSAGLASGTYTLPSDNDWHHLAFVLDGSTNSDTISMYLDGAPLEVDATGSHNNQNIPSTSLQIGRGYSLSSNIYRQGPMDDVRIYSRALTAAEAKQLYLLGK